DDGLRTVDEVTELCLPHHQRFGVRYGVAVLEPDGCVLGQRRVINHDTSLFLGEILQWCVLCAVLAVDEYRMALSECATAGVLTGESDESAFQRERTEREQLAEGPVDAALAGHS